MEKENVVLKNISRCNYTLDLSEVTPRKVIEVGVDKNILVTPMEYEWLITSYPSLFSGGYFQVEKAPDSIEVISSENVFTDEDITSLVKLSKTKLKNQVAKIDSIAVLRDIRVKAESESKGQEFIAVIEERISELDEDALLI